VSLDKEERAELETALKKDKDYKSVKEPIESFEQFGPSIGKLITENAIKAVLLAAACMLIYVFFRFRWRFAVSSILGVFHDVILLIIFYGVFNISVNNPFIAAILTVVGYSINDTIVVFDRIRENYADVNTNKTTLMQLIDRSIWQTIVRSLTTGATTILAIVPLVIIGGETIREFALPLLVGILLGAFSSIFIASSLYYDFAKKTYQKGVTYFGAKKKDDPEAEKKKRKLLDMPKKKKKVKAKTREDLPNGGAVV
jgi:SecD/SecF fusion protein